MTLSSLRDEAIPKMGILLKEKVRSYRSKFLPLRGDPHLLGR